VLPLTPVLPLLLLLLLDVVLAAGCGPHMLLLPLVLLLTPPLLGVPVLLAEACRLGCTVPTASILQLCINTQPHVYQLDSLVLTFWT
jgi:hypothetical protein